MDLIRMIALCCWVEKKEENKIDNNNFRFVSFGMNGGDQRKRGKIFFSQIVFKSQGFSFIAKN
jgi:hypothetical protein